MVMHHVNFLKCLVRDRSGVTALEYTMVTVILATVVVYGVNTIGISLTSAFASLSQALIQRAAGI